MYFQVILAPKKIISCVTYLRGLQHVQKQENLSNVLKISAVPDLPRFRVILIILGEKTVTAPLP